MKISIIIPVYNERERLPVVLEKVLNLPGDIEVIIVDDGSTDGTREWLKENARKNVKVMFHNENQGKGAAIRTGIREITGDVVVIQDADLELDPEQIPSLVEPIAANRAQVVFGSRFLETQEKVIWSTYLANYILTKVTNMVYRTRLTDMMTCYKVFTREIAQHLSLKSPGFDIEPELTARLLRGGWTWCEVPVRYRPRGFREGKKIRFRDFFRVLRAIWKFRKV